MLCCKNCFNSPYVKSYISSLNQQGACDYCESNNVHVCDISDATLGHMFEGLSGLHIEDASSSAGTIESILSEFPYIINRGGFDVGLLTDIFKAHSYTIFTNAKINLAQNLNLTKLWDTFTQELKNTYRFHITEENTLNLDEIQDIFHSYHTFNIPKDSIYYRSRISKGGILYSSDEMNMPPISKVSAKGGRINPIGIPYLYLSSDIQTTLYETRVSHYDKVCSATFQVIEGLRLVDLRKNAVDFAFLSEEEKLGYYYPYMHFISRMSSEFSKPNLNDDKELDYLPTQYIAEFIKVLGFDGLLYDSSLNPAGYNLALFRNDKVVCEDIVMYSIDAVEFKYKKVE